MINKNIFIGGIIAVFITGCSSNTQMEAPLPEPVAEQEVIVTGARRTIRDIGEARGELRSAEEEIRLPSARSDNDLFDHERDVHTWSLTRQYQLFRDYGVNPTMLAEAYPHSTFSLDVDDGSYKLALAMLSQGQLPHEIGVRVEEFVNAQPYRYLSGTELFSLSAEAMPSPFRDGYHILHLGLQTRSLNDDERLPANLVLVADVSGSMSGDKLALLKEGFVTLVSQLRADDRVALVAYSDRAKIVLEPTAANRKRQIINAIHGLTSDGSTNAVRGLSLGYKLAENMYQPGIINRVIFSSDGMANVGADTPEAMLAQIAKQKRKGVFLTTVGVGLGMYNDALMEQLANQGNGNYLYLADSRDIQSVFVDKLTTQLQTVAKNAKVQVVFDEQSVSHYRLLGYENRALRKEDFLDANKDGGEIGAGHRVTALYEIKLRTPSTDRGIGTFRVAYQKPDGRKVYTMEKNIPESVRVSDIASASSDMRLSASAAAFAEKLRMSYWSHLYDYGDILDLMSSMPVMYRKQEEVVRLREAIRTASSLDQRRHNYPSTSSIDLDHVPLLK